MGMHDARKVLIVAAHPDDEVLGCGGTAALLNRLGARIYIAILGEGVTSRYPDRSAAPAAELSLLKTQCFACAALLGAQEPFLYDYPDNRFDTVALLDIVKTVEELVHRLEPDLILTHHGGDLNIDHALTFRAVLTAVRPQPGTPVAQLYTFHVPSATEWAHDRCGPRFSPNCFVDIAATLEQKLKAFGAYGGEGRPFPHPRSEAALRADAAYWGSVAGLPAAEPLQLVRSIVRDRVGGNRSR